MDDVNWRAIPEPWQARGNERLLRSLKRHRVFAGLFVVGQNVDNPQGRDIVKSWSGAGHLIGNHTWTHRTFTTPPVVAAFGEEVDRCEGLVGSYPGFAKLFRFPALKEGRTAEARDEMRRALASRGYRNGAVTIDASDWYFDACLRRKIAADGGFPVERFRAPYIQHILDRAAFYDSLANRVLGAPVRHTLLIHYNLLNVLFLDDLLGELKRSGWTLVSAREAFQDSVFDKKPDTVPAGESLIWALAKESGRFEGELRYPGEDEVYEAPELKRLGLI